METHILSPAAYTRDNTTGVERYIVPHASENANSGLSQNGFNPNDIDPTHIVDFSIGDDGGYQAEPKPKPKPVPKQKGANMITVHMHVPGIRIPYQFHEVHIVSERNMVALVLDKSSGHEPPQFEVGSGNQIVLSCEDHPNLLVCEFFGQQLTIGSTLEVIVLVLVEEQPR